MTGFRVFVARFGALLLLLASSAYGQVTFGGAQRTIPVPGVTLKQVKNVVPDSSGNLFINDVTNQELLKLTPAGAVTTVVTSTKIGGVATDAAGNVYYTMDSTTNPDEVLMEVTAGGVTSTVADLSSFGVPYDVVRDAAGDFYITWADTGGSTGGLVKVSSGGAVSAVNLGGYSFHGPTSGMAMDTAGDLFIVDAGNNRLLEVSAGGTTSVVNTSGLYGMAGVAVDAAGDLFIDTYGDTIEETPAGGGTAFTVGVNLHGPQELALDASGNLYTGNYGSIFEIQLTGLNFGSVSRGGTSGTWTLIYNFSIATNETLTAANVVTQGTAGLDYNAVASGTTCTAAGSYGSSGTTQCLLNVSFTPQAAGARQGAATLSTSAGTLITTYLSGVGTGPQMGFDTGAGSVTSLSGASNLYGAAMDAAGNVIVADAGQHAVLKISATGTVSTVASGLGTPEGVAVDGAGNVYIADNSAGQVIEAPADGGAQTVLGNFTGAQAVAVDGAGDFYVAWVGSGGTQVWKQTPGGTQSEVVAPGASITGGTSGSGGVKAAGTVGGMAWDANGNLYVSEFSNGVVYKVAAGGGTPTAVASGLSYPAGIAVDASGDLYVAELGSHAVVEVAAGGGSAVTLVSSTAEFGSPSHALSYPYGLAMNGAGNLSVIDNGNDRLLKFDRQDAPALSFPATAYGGTSVAQTVKVSNFGTSSLTFTGVSIASGFQQQASGGTDCSSSSVLSAGSVCTLQLAFAPSSVGTDSGSVILTDDASGAGATQTVTLSGTATAAVITPSLTGTVSKAYDGTTAATLTAANYSFAGQVGSDDIGITTPSSGAYASSTAGAGITVTVTGLALTGSAAANYQLSSTTVSGGVGTITKVPLTLTANNAVMSYGGALPSFTGTVTGAVSGDTVTESFATAATSASAVGSYTIVPSLSSANAADYTVSARNGTLTINTAPLAVSAHDAAMTYGGALPSFTGTVAGAVNGDTFTESFTTAATAASGVGAYAIVPAVSGPKAADYSITASNGTLTIGKAPLTVTAAPVSMVYRGALPALTPVYTGFVNGDTAAVLTGAPTLSTTATSASDGGTYPITAAAGTLAAANYQLTFSPGQLTITPATQTVTFPALNTVNYPNSSTVGLAATASSGLPILYSVVSGPATVKGATLQATGRGTVVVEAQQVGSNDYGSANARQTLTVTQAEAALSPASLAFGGTVVDSTSSMVVTLSNPGLDPLSISSMAISQPSGSSEYEENSSACPASLAAGSRCDITVSFSPTVGVPAQTGTLVVADNAGTQQLGLTGDGVEIVFGSADPWFNTGVPLLLIAGQTTSFDLTASAAGLGSSMDSLPIALSCGIIPPNSTCTVTPATATLTPNGTIPVTVTITTQARSLAPGLGSPAAPFSGPRPPSVPLDWRALAWLALLLLAGAGLTRRRSRRWLLACVAGGALLAAGCGGINNELTAGGGTPPGHYTLTIEARSGTAVRTVPVNLVVY